MDDSVVLKETFSKLTDKNLEGKVEYSRTNLVSFGSQGYVYMGTLRPSGSLVAVKEMRVTARRILGMKKVSALFLLRDE